MWFFKCRI